MDHTLPDYLKNLNAQQKEAVISCVDPLLVLAGAGSGKTRVITTKIAHLITRLKCPPTSILAVTFTNKAATEMKERVTGMSEGAEAVMIKTFHAFGAWLLRRFGDSIGLSQGFTIYDDDDSLTLLHGLYPSYRRSELKPYIRSISRAKDYCLSPDDDLTEISRDPRFPEMYRAYEQKIRQVGNVDFGDLIYRSVELLRKKEHIRLQIQNRFRAILVDEYQDSNVAQYQLLQQLFSRGCSLCVVGDDDQSIYRFRGAELMNILTFPDKFPNTKIVKLEENYRSTGNILAIAEAVVNNNQGRHEKRLWTQKGQGPKATVAYLADQFAEAQYCADIVDRDANYDGTAILYRTNAQSAALETVFMRLQIPYKIVGALRFYDREEVKDALALLSLVLNPADEVAFKRVINKPARGIGRTSVDKILAAASSAGGCIAALEYVQSSLRGKAKEGAAMFLEWYRTALDLVETCDLAEFARTIVEKSGIAEYHRRQDEIALTQKENNLRELINAAGEYPPGKQGIAEFLEFLELDPTRIGKKDPSDQPGVTLITMHNTKGLEFDRVIITGMEEGLFPGQSNTSDDEIEEERRICYVSITRARKELYFTSCRRRAIWGKISHQSPSRFLDELPQDKITVRGNSALTGYQNSTRRQGGGTGYPGFGRQINAASFSSGYEKPGKSSGKDEGEFSTGERVYHDEYGAGYVMSSVIEKGRETVVVQFETGRKGTFITRYARLEKIAQD